jgi:Ca2+/H+ antiporter
MLIGATVVVALEAEPVSDAVTATIAQIHVSTVFLGVIVLALVSTCADLFAVAGTEFVVRAIAADGETTWFEGLLLVGVYVLFGLGFFLVSTA